VSGVENRNITGPRLVACLLFASALAACSPAELDAELVGSDERRVVERYTPEVGEYAALYSEVEPGEFDPLTIPFENGIVWYGTWEGAMAEKERTGKPVMLHFGSPRCPKQKVCVPGTW